VQGRGLGFMADLLPSKTDQLINSRHSLKTPQKSIITPLLENKRKEIKIIKILKKSQ
jgi:hypothetical protein